MKITKENARLQEVKTLRTRLIKTPVAAGDLLTKVGTITEAEPLGEVYRLISWEFPHAVYVLLQRHRNGDWLKVPGARLQRMTLSDFGLETFAK